MEIDFYTGEDDSGGFKIALTGLAQLAFFPAGGALNRKRDNEDVATHCSAPQNPQTPQSYNSAVEKRDRFWPAESQCQCFKSPS